MTEPLEGGSARAWSGARASRSVDDFLRRLAAPAVLPVVIALVIGALVAFAGAEYERTRTPVYQSSTVLLLDSPLALSANPGAVISVSEIRAKYAGLVGTDVIAQPAADHLKLPLATVARSVTAGLTPANLNLVLTARGASPAQAQQLAAAVATSLIDYVHAEQANLSLVSPQLRLSMKVVGNAYLGNRVSPNHRRELTTGGILGLVALALVYGTTRAVVQLGRAPTTG